MVRGMALFKEYFSGYSDQYILIGGTACDLAMEEAGQSFRATQDLDIVLCAGALTDEFVSAFWTFVRDGGYRLREKSDGKKEFYRFRNPVVEDFPREMELFSRKPDLLELPEDCTLTPIPAAEDISSLSAILLDDDYYAWILAGTQELQGVCFAGTAHLIPLKMKAWMDLSERREQGETIDSRNVKKHLNDIYRLFTILPNTPLADIPETVRADIRQFLTKAESVDVDLKSLSLGRLTCAQALGGLRVVYGVDV